MIIIHQEIVVKVKVKYTYFNDYSSKKYFSQYKTYQIFIKSTYSLDSSRFRNSDRSIVSYDLNQFFFFFSGHDLYTLKTKEMNYSRIGSYVSKTLRNV